MTENEAERAVQKYLASLEKRSIRGEPFDSSIAARTVVTILNNYGLTRAQKEEFMGKWGEDLEAGEREILGCNPIWWSYWAYLKISHKLGLR